MEFLLSLNLVESISNMVKNISDLGAYIVIIGVVVIIIGTAIVIVFPLGTVSRSRRVHTNRGTFLTGVGLAMTAVGLVTVSMFFFLQTKSMEKTMTQLMDTFETQTTTLESSLVENTDKVTKNTSRLEAIFAKSIGAFTKNTSRLETMLKKDMSVIKKQVQKVEESSVVVIAEPEPTVVTAPPTSTEIITQESLQVAQNINNNNEIPTPAPAPVPVPTPVAPAPVAVQAPEPTPVPAPVAVQAPEPTPVPEPAATNKSPAITKKTPAITNKSPVITKKTPAYTAQKRPATQEVSKEESIQATTTQAPEEDGSKLLGYKSMKYAHMSGDPPSGSSQEKADELFDTGLEAYESSNFEESQVKFEQSTKLYRNLARKDPLTYNLAYGLTQYNLGVLYDEDKQYTKALNYYNAALKIFEQTAQTEPKIYNPVVAQTLNNVGLTYFHMNRYKDALKSYMSSLETYCALDTDTQTIEVTLVNMGILYITAQGQSSTIGTDYKEAIDIIWDSRKYRPYKKDTKSTLATLEQCGGTIKKYLEQKV